MIEFIQIMWMPFLACLILTGIHAYLGLHVIQREVIFVDLALAQIAVLGTSLGIILGYALNSIQSFGIAFLFTLIGAGLFSLTRFRKQNVPHEAIIGIVYVLSSAITLIFLSYSGEGTEHIRQFLMGQILLVNKNDLISIFILYLGVGFIHYLFREKFILISMSPEIAFQKGLNVRAWDFLFYATFGLVVTSSVKLAGVLLVFAFLVIPAVSAMMLTQNIKYRLFWGWTLGTIGSLLGMAVSYVFDLPTGASVVCVFGLLLIISGIYSKYLTSNAKSVIAK